MTKKKRKHTYQTDEPCILEKYHQCGHMQRCYHHVAKRQRSEPIEESWNKMPVCQEAHNEFESRPLSELAVKYPLVRFWLTDRGWRFNGHKWTHPEDNRFRKQEFNNFN